MLPQKTKQNKIKNTIDALTFSVILLGNIYWKLPSSIVGVNFTQELTRIWSPSDGVLGWWW